MVRHGDRPFASSLRFSATLLEGTVSKVAVRERGLRAGCHRRRPPRSRTFAASNGHPKRTGSIQRSCDRSCPSAVDPIAAISLRRHTPAHERARRAPP